MIGAGGFADCEGGAVSTTGTGEHILRFMLAKRVTEAWERQQSAAARLASASSRATAAVESTLHAMTTRFTDNGEGVIFISPEGGVGVGHTSPRMSWGLARAVHGDGPGSHPTVTTAGGVQLAEGAVPGVRVVLPGPEVEVPWDVFLTGEET